jgi:hypothetical protein
MAAKQTCEFKPIVGLFYNKIMLGWRSIVTSHAKPIKYTGGFKGLADLQKDRS